MLFLLHKMSHDYQLLTFFLHAETVVTNKMWGSLSHKQSLNEGLRL